MTPIPAKMNMPCNAPDMGSICSYASLGMNQQEVEAWAAAYIEAVQDPKHMTRGYPLWWAITKFMRPLSDAASPEDCWRAILEILSRSPPDQVISVLAAGPLEDLIDHHGPEFIERIELESRRNPAFRQLLGGVWESSSAAIWSRVQNAQGPLW